MSDAFRKVQRGQKLDIKADAFNAFLDAVRASTRGRKLFGADADQFFRQSGIVKVKNASAVPQPRFAVLGVRQPIILPIPGALDEFKRQVALDVDVPTKDGRYVVLLEPLGITRIGLAVVAGVVPVRLRVDPAQIYDFAAIIENDTSAMQNVPHGSARVLWVEPAFTTERWAIVRLDDGDYQAHVLITSHVPDADGYYPGEVQQYDIASRTWQTLFACKVIDINQ